MYRLSSQILALIVILAVASYVVRALHPEADSLDSGLTREDVAEGEIWVGDAFELAQQPGGVIWIDIRPPEIFAEEHVPGAYNCWPRGGDPIGNVVFDIMGSEQFTPEATIVLYCASTGCDDSHQVKTEINEIAPLLDVKVLAGGWQEIRRYMRRTDDLQAASN